MKYGIWRHENALGNGAEHVINLALFISKNNDTCPEIFVENEWQKMMALCIPGVHESNIRSYSNPKSLAYTTPDWKGFNNQELSDIYMPGVYDFPITYPAGWRNITISDNPPLSFPVDTYDNKHGLPKGAIVMTLREYKTYWKRVDGDDCEPQRFVNPSTFHRLAIHYAQKGKIVVRIGSDRETPFPKHDNIIDFAKVHDRSLLDDLYLINFSEVFISCDSGIWPMAGGLKKRMVLSNVVGSGYTEWLPKETTIILKKHGSDNSFDEITEAVNRLVGL